MSLDNFKPLLPLRDIVIFPSTVVPLFVGRKKSIKALEEVMKSDKSIVLVAQKNSEVDDPKKNDIFSYGCESNILQLLKLPDGTVKVLVEGMERGKIIKTNFNKDYITGEVSKIETKSKKISTVKALKKIVKKKQKPEESKEQWRQASEIEKKELFDPNQIAALIDKSKEETAETLQKNKKLT